MKEVTITLNSGKEIGFKLSSGDIANLEERLKKPFMDILAEVSITNCANLIKYMRRYEVPNFGQNDAYDLLDELIESGYTYNDIYRKIIAQVCVKSGVLSESDLSRAESQIDEKN